jgi:hypothetical protein
MMSPYIFILARIYSSRLPLVSRCDNHERYVRLVLRTPVDRVEKEVDQYFEELYSAFFHPTSAFPGYSPDHLPHGNSDHPF